MTKPIRDGRTRFEHYSDASRERWANEGYRKRLLESFRKLRDDSGKSKLGYKNKFDEERAKSLAKIEIGDRFGALTVEKILGLRPFGNREILFWLCRCDCGSTIELPTHKLRNKNKRLNYRACERCSRKTCVICGSKYSRSRRYDFCTNPECVEQKRLEQQKRKKLRRRKRRS